MIAMPPVAGTEYSQTQPATRRVLSHAAARQLTVPCRVRVHYPSLVLRCAGGVVARGGRSRLGGLRYSILMC